jgi:protein-tyrosine kinase
MILPTMPDSPPPLRKAGLLGRLHPRRAASITSPQTWISSKGFSLSSEHLPALTTNAAAARFVELATILTIGHIAHGRRAIAVCGAATGAGVSFVASNLAVVLAASGIRTRLIDANLRTPSLHEVMRGPPGMPGLSDYLLNESHDGVDGVSAEVLPGLVFTSAGRQSAEAVDLLTSRRFADFAQTCLRDAEITIFDTSPANRSVDPRVVAKEAGYALVVARRTRTYFDDVSTLCSHLNQDHVTIIGTILNGA